MMFNDIHIWIGTYNSENDDVALDFCSSIFCWQIPIHNIQNWSVPGQAAQSLPLTQVRWNSFYSSVVSVSIHLRFQSFTIYAESVKTLGSIFLILASG